MCSMQKEKKNQEKEKKTNENRKMIEHRSIQTINEL